MVSISHPSFRELVYIFHRTFLDCLYKSLCNSLHQYFANAIYKQLYHILLIVPLRYLPILQFGIFQLDGYSNHPHIQRKVTSSLLYRNALYFQSQVRCTHLQYLSSEFKINFIYSLKINVKTHSYLAVTYTLQGFSCYCFLFPSTKVLHFFVIEKKTSIIP